MTTILRLDSSAGGDASVTNGLNDTVVEQLLTTHPDATVVTRDLTVLPVLDHVRLVANNTPDDGRSAAQADVGALADEVISELEAADVLVIGAPIYNFGVPGSLKAWMDLVARAGRTFSYTEHGPVGHLPSSTRVFVTVASGGVPVDSDADHATPHLRTFLGFLGFTDITVIDAGGQLYDPEKVERTRGGIAELVAA